LPISDAVLQTYEKELRQTIQCFFYLEGQIESIVVRLEDNRKSSVQKRKNRFFLSSKKKEKSLQLLGAVQADLRKSLIVIAHIKQLLLNEVNTLLKTSGQLKQAYKEMLPLLPFAVSSNPLETSLSTNVQFSMFLFPLIENEIVFKLPLLTATIESTYAKEIIATLEKLDVNKHEQINEAKRSVANLISMLTETENELVRQIGNVSSSLYQRDILPAATYSLQQFVDKVTKNEQQINVWMDHYVMLQTMLNKGMQFQDALHLSAKLLSESLEEPSQIYQNQRILHGAYLLETAVGYSTIAQDIKLTEQQAKHLMAIYLLLNNMDITTISEKVELEFQEIDLLYQEHNDLLSIVIS